MEVEGAGCVIGSTSTPWVVAAEEVAPSLAVEVVVAAEEVDPSLAAEVVAALHRIKLRKAKPKKSQRMTDQKFLKRQTNHLISTI